MTKNINQLAHEYWSQGHEVATQRYWVSFNLNQLKDAIEDTYKSYPEMLILTRKEGDYLDVLVVDGNKKNSGRTLDAMLHFREFLSWEENQT